MPASAQFSSTPAQTSAPPEATFLSGLKSVAAGDEFSLAVDGEGRLLAWGNYAEKIEGENFSYAPEEIRIIDTGVKSVSAYLNFCAEIKTDGSLWVWGQNDKVCGKAGQPAPVKVLDNVASVALGGNKNMDIETGGFFGGTLGGGFVLAVKTDGTLWAWGVGEYGQLADGGKSKLVSSPKQVMKDVKKAAAGDGFSLILLKDGTLLGCGDNMHGEMLGNYDTVLTFPDNTYAYVHVQLTPIKLMDGITDVVAGRYHGIALDSGGNAWTFGDNGTGQIGDNYGKNTTVGLHTEGNFYYIFVNCDKPVKILSDASTIMASEDGSGAIKKDGSLWLWGGNDYSQQGDSGFKNSYVPKKALDGVRLVSQSVTHTMAVKTDGTLWCWGDNQKGELGVGYTSDSYKFEKVADDVRQVTTSGKTTFIVKKDGSLYGFGCNDAGQLAGASETSISSPVLMMKDVAEAAVGDSATFCVKTDGTLWGWGGNAYGALGSGVLEDGKFSVNPYELKKVTKGYKEQLVTPRKISGPFRIFDGVRHIYAFHNVTLAVKNDGALWGWGMNEYGSSFPDSSSGNTATPEKKADDVDSVLCLHMLNKTDGALCTWGNESIGDAKQTLTKKTLSKAVSAVEGDTWRAAVTEDGALWVWGEFGDKEIKEPIKIEDHIKKITDGTSMLILKDDNTLYRVLVVTFERFAEALDGKSEAHLLSNDFATKELEGVADAAPAYGVNGISILALKTDGSLWAKGYDKYGQLGSGKVFFVPTQVSK